MSKTKSLLVRMDKIGDLILSLGVDQHPEFQSRNVKWLVPDFTKFVVQASLPRRDFLAYSKKFSWKNFFALVSWLKKEKFDEAVFFQGEKWLLFALWWAGIPKRVGTKSSLWSYLFLNSSVRQKRSQVEMSEFEYNKDLVERGLGFSQEESLAPTVLSATASIQRDYLLQEFYVVHAGMGGSALNWSQEKYIDLIQKLIAKNKVVVLTGTEGDKKYLDKILKFTESLQSNLLVNEIGKLSGDELLKVLQEAKAVLAPSTGVLHLAASLKASSVGLYPPVRVQSIKRWGAYGEKVKNLAPSVECPEVFRCRGEACQYFPCMESMSPDYVLGELLND